jgi:hypothetical protein
VALETLGFLGLVNLSRAALLRSVLSLLALLVQKYKC